MTQRESRRNFLRALSRLAAIPTAIPHQGLALSSQLAGLAAMSAQSSNAADLGGSYKALVCLFLSGGSDSHNWVVPVDAESYASYAKARPDLAWSPTKLQTLSASGQAAGRSFGVPIELAKLTNWYEAGKAAIVANVGPLVRPLTKSDYLASVGLPQKLYSHNDQTSTWQSLSPEGAPSGWGGRMGDLLMAANAYPVFTAVSATGNAVFLTGQNVTQFQLSAEGPTSVSALEMSSIYGSSRAPAALRRTLNPSDTNPLLTEYARVLQRGINSNAFLQKTLGGVNVPTVPANKVAIGNGATTLDKIGLARQLKIVLQLIAANQTLGMRRQVFMVSMGGFDTHANQMRDQPGQMAQVAASIDYFLSGLASIGLLNNVTLFTASEFGRTLLSNGDGTDHGWGGHHFVAGGAVRGRAIYGRFPDLARGSADDVGSGRLLPTTSVIQLAATVGNWMGLSRSDLSLVLPQIGAFGDPPPFL